MTPQTIEGIRFGDFILDVQGRRLLHEGRRVALGPLEFKLLETLIKNRDRVLTGDELRILVWAEDPSQQVVPAQDVNALYVSIRKLRAALGDTGKWIVNIPKVGYTISEEAIIEDQSTPLEDIPEINTPFVGRSDEVLLISKALSGSRLVTLVGPPGIGKTRLAVECARSIAGSFSNGVHLIDLASIDDPQFVFKVVVTSLELADETGQGSETELLEFLRSKSALLIFDNCEHVIEEASRVIGLLRRINNIRIIATSREPLLLADETVVTVGPLAVPKADENLTKDNLLGFDSANLFVELAKRRSPEFDLTSRDIPFIAELCRSLEGIPVAIELAAAQVDAYSVEQIVSVMADRFRLLQRRGGEASRHNTLEAAIEWSYNLLSNEEQTLLRRLSVLKGGWTADIASKICADDGICGPDIVHLLAGLVRRSLIQMFSRKGSHRYNMLEMIRQYGRRKLSEAEEESRMLEKRTAVFLDLVERSFEDGDRGEWPAILEAEYDNIRAVLTHTIDGGNDIVSGIRICGALSRFWFNHGHIGEAQKWIKAALKKDDRSSPPARARVLMAAGFFFGQTPGQDQDADLRRAYFEESIDIWTEIGDKRNLGVTLIGYAFFLNRHGEYDKAEKVAEKSVEVLRKTDSHVLISRAANNLALTLLEMGKFDRALPILEEALNDARVSDDVFLEAVCLHNLGEVALHLLQLDKAADFVAGSLRLFESLGLRPNVAKTKLLQGELIAAKGDLEAALKLQREALAEYGEIGDNQGIASAFEAIAATLSLQGRELDLAILLESAAGSLREKLKIGLGPAKEKLFRTQMESTKAAVVAEVTELAASKGRTMSVAQVIELVLSRI